MYKFTEYWFDVSELKQNLHKYVNSNDINSFLEIGSFEGASACFISDNFLNIEGSTLVCVDPFDTSDSTSPVYSDIKKIFVNNIKSSKNWNKIRVKQMYSIDFFKINNNKYSFIYIDGSHLLEDIESDFNNSMNIILDNGIIWMDDYGSSEQVTNLINDLYEKNKDHLNIIHKGYQIAFRKLNK